MHLRYRITFILASVGILFPSLLPLLAFDPNNLLSDHELVDSSSMDLADIQGHLERGYLGNYITEDHAGERKTAAEIIYQAAVTHGINPKFLIVLLQKEQSLVEDDDPTQTQLDWATGYAVCDACTTTNSEIQRWKGFGKQVNSAALQFIEGYMADLEANGRTVANYGPWISVEIDDVLVTPVNNATAAMYTYTPHLHGNENFVEIWTSYFTQLYPSGSLLQAKGEEGVWLIQYGLRRPITSSAALLSRYNPDHIIQVDPTVLQQYEQGDPIAFPNYSLLRDPDGVIYLIVDDERRPIDSMETFLGIGFSEDEIIDVTANDLNPYEEGEEITIESAYPKGQLLQNSTTGGVYFVEDGVKYPLMSRTILDVRFKNWQIIPTDPVVLDSYKTGGPVLLPEGTLVKSTDASAVYVISEKMRRPILSGELFEEMGWKWEQIVVTDEKTLDLHEEGEAISDGIAVSEEEEDYEISTQDF